MKKKLLVIFSLFFMCMFINAKNVFADEVSMLCEYNITDKNIKLQFQLYSKDGGDNFKAQNAWIIKTEDGGKNFFPASDASIIRYYKNGKSSNKKTWVDFNNRKSCNSYVAYYESNGALNFILYDEESKGHVDSKYKKGYKVKTTNNYVYSGSPLKQEFVGQYTCGNSKDSEVIRFHKNLPTFTSRMYDFLKIMTPVIIIITGMIDIVKAVTAQKEDEMKKAQKSFINRLIAGSIVFLIFVIVEFVINFVAEKEVADAMKCVNCFLNGDMSTKGCTPAP